MTSDLTFAAQLHGWKRERFGTGRTAETFRRDTDKIEFKFNPESGGVTAVLINGEQYSDDIQYMLREAQHVITTAPQVRRLRAAIRQAWDDSETEGYAGPDPHDVIPHDILEQNVEAKQLGAEDVSGVYVRVGSWEDGFTLWWTDGVANDWTEFYPKLSSLMARLAALVFCGERQWEVGFAGEPDDFDVAAQTWFDSAGIIR